MNDSKTVVEGAPVSENMKRTVRVTIEKEIEIEFTPTVLDGMTEEEYLAEFRKSLWHVDSIDDVFKYAACCAADNGAGYQHDGIGLVDEHDSTYRRVPDVKFKVLSDDVETEILKGD